MLKTPYIAVLLLCSTVAGAQAPTSSGANTPPPAATAAKPQSNKSDLDRVVCEKQDTIGSHVGARKICLTVAQWQEFQREQQAQMLKIEENIGLQSR